MLKKEGVNYQELIETISAAESSYEEFMQSMMG